MATPPTPMAANGKPERAEAIVALEDDPNILALLTDVLSDEGYGVLPTRRGADAIDLCRGPDIGLLLLDLGLPDIDGNQVLVQLKSNPSTSDLPIIVISAHPESLRNAAFVEAVIGKPFDLQDLLFEVERVLRGLRTRRNGEETTAPQRPPALDA